MSNLKFNINHIHSLLSQRFDNVVITEMDSPKFGKYFQLEVNENFKVKMILPIRDILNSNAVRWYYESNPEDATRSSLVERISNINNIDIHVKDILDNQRFEDSYRTTYIRS